VILPESCFVDPAAKRRRGRPKRFDGTAAEVFERSRLAREVFSLAAGGGRGALSAAIEQVAARHNLAPATVKKIAARWRDGRRMVELERELFRQVEEMDRRCAGMPDDVRARIDELPFGRLLRLLRRHQIDGACPRWLADCARATSHLGPTVMMVALDAFEFDGTAPESIRDFLQAAPSLEPRDFLSPK